MPLNMSIRWQIRYGPKEVAVSGWLQGKKEDQPFDGLGSCCRRLTLVGAPGMLASEEQRDEPPSLVCKGDELQRQMQHFLSPKWQQ